MWGVEASALLGGAPLATTGLGWAFPNTTTMSDVVVRSQSGRIMQDTITQGASVKTSTYTYDAAGRLTAAVIPNHTLGYSFAASGACGTNPTAGLDGNRTGMSDVKTGGGTTSVAYCYDTADRLTNTTTSPSPPVGADPVLATNLSQAGGTLTYDSHGNTTKLADQTLTYDVADQHVKTVSTDGTTVTYLRDVSGRIVQRTAHPVTGVDDVERYTYAGGGDSAWGVLDATTNARQQRFVNLPGGATVSIDSRGVATWTFSGIHGGKE